MDPDILKTFRNRGVKHWRELRLAELAKLDDRSPGKP